MIRKARVEDASRIAEILVFSKRMAYRQIFKDDDYSFNRMQVLPLALDLMNPESEIKDMIVFDDSIVKGLATRGKSSKDDIKDAYELSALYVDPSFQHEGVGSKLLEHFLNEARKKGYNKVFLWVLIRKQLVFIININLKQMV